LGRGAERSEARPRAVGRSTPLSVLLLLLACFLALPARAQTFPPFTGLVTDAANVLPADRKAALQAKLEALQQQTGHQLVVATLPDLGGRDLADYAYRLGRAWGVGLKDANNGILLLVAPNEPAGQRGPRIEVGPGLQPIVTDALSSVIIRTRMMPLIRTDLPGALDAGVDALAEQLRLPDAEARARADKAAREFDRTHRRRGGSDGFPIGGVIILGVIAFVVLGAMRGRQRGGQAWRGRGGGGDWPIWLWAASELMDRRGGGGWGDGGSGGGMFGGGGGGSDGSWGGGGFTGGGGGSFDGGGASGDW